MGNLLFTVIVYPLTQIIEFVFEVCNKITSNVALSLVGVSLAVGFLTLPLYIVAEHWQQVERDTQASMKGTVDRIKSVFKGNEQYMILSTYYKQCSYHPLYALRSAFGLLIQVPFFTAAYSCLSNMTSLKGVGFWIFHDLGQPDALFSIGSFTVNVLPIAMTLINCIAGAIYTKGLPIKEKIQVNTLAIVFLALLYNSPSGLVFYWTMNNIFSLVKNVFYKLKRPVFTLYKIFVSLSVIAIIATVFSAMKTRNKGFIIAACLFIISLPAFVKGCNVLIDKFWGNLKSDRKQRFALFLSSAAAMTLLSGIIIPSLLINSSVQEFCGIDNIEKYANPVFFVKNTLSQAIGLYFVWPCLIFFLFKERLQTFLAGGSFFILAASLVNVFFFQGNYGYLSKMLIFTQVPDVWPTVAEATLNISILVLLFIVCISIVKRVKTKELPLISSVIAVAFLAMGVINCVKINNEYSVYKNIKSTSGASTNSSKIEPIFHLSKTGKNVLLIFLDKAQNNYVEPMMEESPELASQFSGFTLYKNTLSFNSHTLMGAPCVYGGYEYTPLEMNKRSETPLQDKHNEAIMLLPRIFTEQANNFAAISSDPSWANYSWIPDMRIFKDYPAVDTFVTENAYLENWYKDHSSDFSSTATSDALKRNILWYSIFREVPMILRGAIYKSGKYWSTNVENEDLNTFVANYAVMEYLKQLTDFESKNQNVFMSFTNNATHESFPMQAPDYVIEKEVTNRGNSEYKDRNDYTAMAGVMHRLGEWLDFLKENGIYDNTRIVIVSDHGGTPYESCFNNDEAFKEIEPGRYHPLLMFKDFGESGALKTSMDFMTNADAPAMLLEGLVEKPINPFTKKEISTRSNQEIKKDGVTITTDNLFMPFHSKSKNIFTVDHNKWFKVKDNIFESSNWKQEEK